MKKQAVGKRAEVLFARRAIDAYLDAITGKLYGGFLIYAFQASERALELAVSIIDKIAGWKLIKKPSFSFRSVTPRQLTVWTL